MTTVPLTITVEGVPRPQGSMSVGKRRDGRAYAYYPETVVRWRKQVTDAAKVALAVQRHGGFGLQPVVVTLAFDLDRPKSHYGTGRNSAVLKRNAPVHHLNHPDLDKLARSIGDSLTDAGVWGDDSQVVELFAVKRYTAPGDVAGATIRIEVA